MGLSIKKLSWGVQEKRIIEKITLDIKTGDIVGLVGPNGSGKSSLLRLIYRYYRPTQGSVFLDKNNISLTSQKEIAKKMAVVPQERGMFQDVTVYEVVAMGRIPYKGLFDLDTQEDHRIVLDSLKKVGLLNKTSRSFDTLSGGEKQRVLIALALAQETKMLVLDEPTNYLDPLYQLQIMGIIKGLKKTTVIAMHDLNMAARYCDRIVLLNKGKIIAYGKPLKVLTSKNIKEVYGVKVRTNIDEETGRLNITLLGIDGRRSFYGKIK
jgi:iron complex transport system ATP-binding protein